MKETILDDYKTGNKRIIIKKIVITLTQKKRVKKVGKKGVKR